MRTTTALCLAMALAALTQVDAFGQCQRGGRGPQSSGMTIQTGGITQAGLNPILAMQQTAMQQAFMQQQIAAQQMRMQQSARREQARQSQLAQRRTAAQQRRAAELVRREQVRAANLEKLKASGAQETPVALRGIGIAGISKSIPE